jgi:GNAT superfamily N-acetyltransferase
MAPAKTPEELAADWWANWWETDYSWNGLAQPDKKIAGKGGLHGEQSLQDYWRIDPATGNRRSDTDMRKAGELETAPDGTSWHIAHVPLVWRDGSAAKAGWSDKKRALLTAIVATRINVAQETSVTLGPWAEEDVASVDGRAQLQGSILCHPPAHPNDVAVPIHINATGCWLSCWDAAGQTFGPGASFERVFFADGGLFEYATFSGSASFFLATFLGVADFEKVNFLGDARFNGSTFLDVANFKRATFSDNVSFNGAIFQGSAMFEFATLLGDARFKNATFSDYSIFFRVTVSGNANFSGANFLNYISFDSARFERSASFRETKFETKDGDVAYSGRMEFTKTVFTGPVDFDKSAFAANPVHHSAAFLGARFADIVSFRGCGDYWVAALDEAELKGRILIDERDESDCLHDFDTVVLPRARDGGENPWTGEALLKELEGGCRTIKVAMGAARNEIMEQRYYRFQLLARREQQGVPHSERLVSYLFGWAADYGLSLTRPLIGLALLMIAFTVIHAFFWHATGDFGSIGLFKSIEMAASRMFPFGAFEFVSRDWFTALEKRGADRFTLLLGRLFASLQSLIALLLIFVLGLAVRRRVKVGE